MTPRFLSGANQLGANGDPPSALLAALVALGLGGCGGSESPAAPPAGPEAGEPEASDPWFAEEAGERGLAFVHRSGHDERYLMPEIMGGGAALFDLEGDGDLDAFLVQSTTAALDGEAGNEVGHGLFENRGGGRFERLPLHAGPGPESYGMGVACGDVDEDGDVDLYVTCVGPDLLLENLGERRLADATDGRGAGHAGWGTSAAFLDADRDGDLDLYVAEYLVWSAEGELDCENTFEERDYCDPQEYGAPARDVFLENAEGRFRDRSVDSGVAASPGTGLGVGCGDFDGDGWIDVFVANDGMPDFLWRNREGAGFVDVAAETGCAVDENGVHKAGMGVALADVDRDGNLDIFVCNLNRESDSLFLNRGSFFVDRTSRSGLAETSKGFTRFGMALVDLDNDGYVDLYQANGRVNRQDRQRNEDPYAEPNLLLRGDAKGRFAPLEPPGGALPELVATSRAAAFGDVDDDGFLDVLVANRDGAAHLLVNRRARTGNRWAKLDVRERSGRSAIGATVLATLGGERRRYDVRAAFSYLASNDPRISVGLGREGSLEDVVVRWADGELESFGSLTADRVHVLRRGTGRSAR